MQSTTEQKKSFAAKSLLANLRDDTFVRLFPEKAEEMRDLLRRKRAELGAKGNLRSVRRLQRPPADDAAYAQRTHFPLFFSRPLAATPVTATAARP